jgi:hypothetical protein
MTSSLLGRPPTSYNVFDSNFNRINQLGNWSFSQSVIVGSGSVYLISGSNSPEGAVTAPQGSLFLRTNGDASTTLYVKESGGLSNTGWVAK